MAQINNTDLVLKALYDRRAHNGMVAILSKLRSLGYFITLEELTEIKQKLDLTRFAVIKKLPNGSDMEGAITQTGIDFVQKNSFTNPGTSILKII